MAIEERTLSESPNGTVGIRYDTDTMRITEITMNALTAGLRKVRIGGEAVNNVIISRDISIGLKTLTLPMGIVMQSYWKGTGNYILPENTWIEITG